MLHDAKQYSRIYLAYGYTDLRFGIDGLARVVQDHFSLDPFQKGTLFLFCGRRTDRIKGLLWEGDGFLLVYKRLEDGRFKWPRTASEAREITPEQFTWLMQGLAIEQRTRIKEVAPKRCIHTKIKRNACIQQAKAVYYIVKGCGLDGKDIKCIRACGA